MKKVLLFIFSCLAIANLSAQTANCSKLFISEYVEGYGNNRALEIYNPTPNAINLNNYSVGRFRDGAIAFTGIQIPTGHILQPYKTFVIVLDKRDSTAAGQDIAVWNGYQKWGVCKDSIGNPIILTNGDTLRCVQFDATGNALKGSVYSDFLDLQGKADIFLCNDYNVNNAMYYNGNDAVAIIEGTTVNADGSNILDVVGVIGVNPGTSWVDKAGKDLTKDRTLQRKDFIKKGVGALITPDTFAYVNWRVRGKDTFTGLRSHSCQCDPNWVNSSSVVGEIPFAIYPNPSQANGTIAIEATETIESVQFFNLLGQLIATQNISNADSKVQIELPNVQRGMYLLQVNFSNHQTSARKIIIE